MKKRGMFLLVFLNLMFFIGIGNVSAVTCADIEKEIDSYNTIEKGLKNVDCTKNTDSTIVNTCNKLNLQKSQQLSKFYKLKESNKTCASQIDKITTIIDSNKDSCSLVSDGFLEKMTQYFMGIFYIIGPILVIIFGSLDYTKAVVASDPEALKKATNKFAKRILAVLLLFLSPVIVNLIIGLNTSDNVLSGDSYVCGSNYINLKKTYTIKYVPKEKKATTIKRTSGNNNSDVSTSEISGNFASWKQYAGAWKDIPIGCGAVRQCGCLLTAVSIQVANSGTTKSSSYTPSTFINAVKKNGGLTPGGGFTWKGWSSVAPNFVFKGKGSVSGTQENKAKTLAKYISQGYYPVVEVKDGGCGQHWVAVLSVKNSEITIADPGSTATKLNKSSYPCFISSNHEVGLFKKK